MKTELLRLDGFKIPVRHSEKLESSAKTIAQLCFLGKKKLDSLFGFSPQVEILVLSESDWPSFSYVPVYGIPHYNLRQIIIPGESCEHFQNLISIIENAAHIDSGSLRAIYPTHDDSIDLLPFFQTLVLHELGHSYHVQYSFQFPRLWIQELFANLCNITTASLIDADRVALLNTFPTALSQVEETQFQFTTLQDFEENYESMEPTNYAWYQSRLKVLANDIYLEHHESALVGLWNEFSESDSSLLERMQQKISPILTKLV